MRDIIRAILASPVPVVSYVGPRGRARRAPGPTSSTRVTSPPWRRRPTSGPRLRCRSAASRSQRPRPAAGRARPEQRRQRPQPAAVPPQRPARPPRSPSALPAAPWSARWSTTRSPTSAAWRSCAAAMPTGRSSAVRGAASLSATRRRLQQKVIDVIARDIPDLLTQIDGREVRIGDRTREARDAQISRVERHEAGLAHAAARGDHQSHRRLRADADRHLGPAAGRATIRARCCPGVAGSICLLVALFAFQILSVNYAGLALVALGVGHDRRRVLLPDLRLARPGRSDRVRRRLAHSVRYATCRA